MALPYSCFTFLGNLVLTKFELKMFNTEIIQKTDISVVEASSVHMEHADYICKLIETATKTPGAGIAKRTPHYISTKIKDGKAIIAFLNSKPVGFCYIETWEHGKYVANSGLVVKPEYRDLGLARKIKAKAFSLSRRKYPEANIFGLTTSLAVMKINSVLGYRPVTFSELTKDDTFWQGCSSCVNYDILQRTRRQMCLCTGMLFKTGK